VTGPTEPQSTSLADGAWHRLHPAPPLFRGGIFMVAVLGFILANLRERVVDFFFRLPTYGDDPIDEIFRRGAVGWALLVIAAVLIVILVAFYLMWRMHTFRVDEESVEVRSGVLLRSNRRARLDRIQGVNISRPLFPRLFGAARVEVSVAGQDATVQLAYLGSAVADGLRRDILRLASGARQAAAPASQTTDAAAPAGDAPDGDEALGPDPAFAPAHVLDGASRFAAARVQEFLAPELDPDAAPPESVVRIPPQRLAGSVALSVSTLVLVALAVGIAVTAVVGNPEWIIGAVVPVLGGLGYTFSRFTKSLRYSIAGTPDGVRVGYGLLSTTNETLPPGRIHAIHVFQPLLWRPFGWWQIRINKAERSANRNAAQASTTTLPVGTLDDVMKVLGLILPGYADDQARTLLTEGMLGRGHPGDGFTNAPARAVWRRPLSWRRTGYAIDDGVVLFRRGVITRDLMLVPLARLQSVGISQGPLQRMQRLASAKLHTVSGPVTASLPVVAQGQAVELFQALAAGAVASAEADTSHRWRSADVAAAPAVGPAAPLTVEGAAP
jgi:putative membrane protein